MDLNASAPRDWLTCQEVIDFLMDYIDGELSDELRSRFEDHLQRCSACTSYLDSYTKTVALGKQSFSDPQERVDEMPQDLIEAILNSRGKSSS